MKKFIIFTVPLLLLVYFMMAIFKGFWVATIVMVSTLLFVFLVVLWEAFVDYYFDD